MNAISRLPELIAALTRTARLCAPRMRTECVSAVADESLAPRRESCEIAGGGREDSLIGDTQDDDNSASGPASETADNIQRVSRRFPQDNLANIVGASGDRLAIVDFLSYLVISLGHGRISCARNDRARWFSIICR